MTVREADIDGLVNVKHVDIVVPAVLVQRRGGLSVDEVARPVLLEQSDHRRAAGAAVEPGGHRSGLAAVSGFEEPAFIRCNRDASLLSDIPKPHVHVFSNRQVSGVLVHPGRGLANARVLDKLHLRASRCMLVNIVLSTIALDD